MIRNSSILNSEYYSFIAFYVFLFELFCDRKKINTNLLKIIKECIRLVFINAFLIKIIKNNYCS